VYAIHAGIDIKYACARVGTYIIDVLKSHIGGKCVHTYAEPLQRLRIRFQRFRLSGFMCLIRDDIKIDN